MADTIADNNTPAAARSFALPILIFSSFVIASPRFSTAELNISATKTKPIANIINNHSCTERLNQMPANITRIVTARCIHELCSSLKRCPIPLKAYLKLISLALNENGFFLSSIADF